LDEIVGFHGDEDGGLERWGKGRWEMGTRVPVAVFVLGKALGVAVDFLAG
jgi:hypothetical protein